MKKLASLLVIALLIAGCKKYEEGPAISLSSKSSRIEGKWEIKKVIVNDIEDTDYLITTPEIEFTKDGGYTYSAKNPYTGAVTTLEGSWEFRSNKTKLLLGLENSFNAEKSFQLWDIRMLKKDEIHLEMIDFDKLEWHLVSK